MLNCATGRDVTCVRLPSQLSSLDVQTSTMSFSPLPPDPYEVLGISIGASQDTIKKAFLDRLENAQDGSMYMELFDAYHTLGFPKNRRRYDIQAKRALLRQRRMMRESPQDLPRSTTPTHERVVCLASEAMPGGTANRSRSVLGLMNHEYMQDQARLQNEVYMRERAKSRFEEALLSTHAYDYTSSESSRPDEIIMRPARTTRQASPQSQVSQRRSRSRQRRASSARSASSMNRSLRDGRTSSFMFDHSYQKPEFARRRAGSASSV